MDNDASGLNQQKTCMWFLRVDFASSKITSTVERFRTNRSGCRHPSGEYQNSQEFYWIVSQRELWIFHE